MMYVSANEKAVSLNLRRYNPVPPPNFDDLGIIRRLAGKFKQKCAGINGYFQDVGARYHRMKQHGGGLYTCRIQL
jgi:hypothetical protein